MTNKTYIKNTALLFAAMAVTKIVGAVFKIPLANILGGTGMGYFSSAYSLYSPVFAVTAAGVPTVIMRLTAKNLALGRKQNAEKLKRTALLLFAGIGLAGTLLIWLFSGYFARNIACSPESTAAIGAIAPAVFFCCIASVIRGYYEGCSNVMPTAAANITEAVSRAAVGLALSYGVIAYAKYCFDRGSSFFGQNFASYEQAYNAALPLAAAAAILAVSFSEAAGLAALLVHDRRHKTNVVPDTTPVNRRKAIITEIFRELAPIAAFALVMNCFSFVDLLTVTRTLNGSVAENPEFFMRTYPNVFAAGVKAEELANFMYGSYTGIAMSLFMLIPSFAGMTEKTSIPEIASAWEKGDMETLCSKASNLIKASALIGFPACFGAFALAKPIMTALYPNRAAEVSVSIGAFSVLCLGGVLMITASSIFGIFQAIGKGHIPLWIMVGVIVVKAILNTILMSIPQLNITGSALATVISYGIAAVVGTFLLRQKIGKVKILSSVFAPALSAAACALTAAAVYNALSCTLEVLSAVAISVVSGGAVYIILLILVMHFRQLL